MKHTIKLKNTEAGWLAIHTDPSIYKLFGTSTVPTAFTTNASQDIVYNEIKKLNPEYNIEVIR